MTTPLFAAGLALLLATGSTMAKSATVETTPNASPTSRVGAGLSGVAASPRDTGGLEREQLRAEWLQARAMREASFLAAERTRLAAARRTEMLQRADTRATRRVETR